MNDGGEGVVDADARPAWAWIDRSALAHNARRALDCADGRSVIGVVKANGYGHGAETVARALLAEGVSRLAVVSVGEGASLRRAGIVAPILLLGGLDDPDHAARAAHWSLTPVLHDERGVELASRFGHRDAPLAVEVEIDTGMARMGVPDAAAEALLDRIESSPALSLSGVFTHLACADENDPAPSHAQLERFATRMAGWSRGRSERPTLHAANSAGLLRLKEIEGAVVGLSTSAVRPGLMLYGLTPFADRSAEHLDLAPAMSLAARVIAVRRLAAGDPVGYGAEWRATAPTTIATLPLGYADGIPRTVLGRGEVHLAGALRPIVGRISMDSVCIDVGDAPVDVGDVATIFGLTADGVRVPVEGFAAAAGTIGYEIVVGIGHRVPRLVRDGPPGAS